MKKSFFVCIAAVFLLLTACVNQLEKVTALQYDEAIELIKSSNYIEAQEVLKKISEEYPDYKNSEILLLYITAVITYEENETNPIDALPIIEKIPKDYDGEFMNEIATLWVDIDTNIEKVRLEEEKRIAEELERLEKEKQLAELRKEAERQLQQKKIVEDYEKEIETCPLQITNRWRSYNSIGIPELSVSCKNISTKTVDAFSVNFYCYDDFNRRVNHYARSTNIFSGIAQRQSIKPGGMFDGRYSDWTIHGHDNTTKFFAVITEIHFTDNTTWKISQSSLNYAQTFADEDIKFTTFG